MPVHKNPDGTYQFGETGKKYPTKAQAQAQERAIYASGWRESENSKEDGDHPQSSATLEKGERFFAKHIESGPAQYGEENVLILDDVLNKMDDTFTGCPLFIGHRDEEIVDCNDGAVGYVIKSFLNKNDGAHWAEILVTRPEGLDAIRQGMSVSNSYIKSETERVDGRWHNIPYSEKVLDGYYEHLALVSDPRYESSMVLTPAAFDAYNEEKRASAVLVMNSSDARLSTKQIENKEENMEEDKKLAEENRDLRTKIEEHKQFEKEEEANLKQAEDINKREAEVMDNGCRNEVDDRKHEDDMQALDRRIADSFEDMWKAKMSDKEFWKRHIRELMERKEDDEEAEKEYKKERSQNSLGAARARGGHEEKYETLSDYLARGNELYGR